MIDLKNKNIGINIYPNVFTKQMNILLTLKFNKIFIIIITA